MFYLLLAIIASSLVSIVMRLTEKKVNNNMLMFSFCYGVCTLMAYLFKPQDVKFIYDSDMFTALIIGVITGFLYLSSYTLLKKSIEVNGVVLSTTFMKLGVIIPTIMAIIIFKEELKLIKTVGIVLALIAIFITNFDKENSGNVKYMWLLVLLFFANGFGSSMANIYDKLGNNTLKDFYLIFTYGFATILAIVLFFKNKKTIHKEDIISGILIGLPSYFVSRFLLMSLHEVPATIVYPAYSVGTIIVVTLVGVIFFKEKLSIKKIISIFMILVALILLNI